MSRECSECGVGPRGGSLVEIGGTTYCENCGPAGACHRCGRETEQLDLTGGYTCKHCRQIARDRDETREAGQHGLEEWSE